MIENLSQLKDFLALRGTDAAGHQFWTIPDHVLSSRLAGSQGYIPEGLFEYREAKSFEDVIAYLCDTKEGVGNSVFQVVNLDVRDDDPNTLVMSAVRMQGFPEHDAMLLCSASSERIAKTREELQNSPLLQTQAVFLVDTSNMQE